MTRSFLLSIAGLALSLALVNSACADVVIASGNPGGASSQPTLVPPVTSGVYEISGLGIRYDPNAAPWKKILQNVVPGAGGVVQLIENLQVVGVPWTDWHQEILTPGWSWNTAITSVPTSSITKTATTVDFVFQPPLAAGTNLSITKTFIWTGTGQPNPGPVEINQWPTVPEPTSVAVLMSGLVAVGLAWIWRRRK